MDPVSTPKSPRQSGTFPREIETSPSEARIVEDGPVGCGKKRGVKGEDWQSDRTFGLSGDSLFFFGGMNSECQNFFLFREAGIEAFWKT